MKTSYILIPVTIGVSVAASVTGILIAKKYYEKKMYKEIDKEVEKATTFYKKEQHNLSSLVDDWRDFSKYAARKSYEMFKLVSTNCSIPVANLIARGTDEKMEQIDCDLGKDYFYRLNLIILDLFHEDEKDQTEEDKEEAAAITSDLKYSSSGNKIDLEELYRRQMRKAAEEGMMSNEDLDQDAPPLAPNGDILDEAWDDAYQDEEDPEAHGVPTGPRNYSNQYAIISEDDFVNDEEYEKDYFNYYIRDDMLADCVDDLADVSLVGEEAIEMVKRKFEENPYSAVVYVRNERLNTDFEIVASEDPSDNRFSQMNSDE